MFSRRSGSLCVSLIRQVNPWARTTDFLVGKCLTVAMAGRQQPSSDMAAFRKDFAKAKHIVVLTGAGVSAESGVPTFRGAGGFWRKYQAQAHIAIAECEKRLALQGRRVVVITQNIDELHRTAGTQNIQELHGSLFKTRCTKCSDVAVNRDSPICESLRGKGAPEPEVSEARIPVDQLPKCKKSGCGGLLRPHVVWFGESLNRNVLEQSGDELDKCDLCLVVGTSSVVYPAAMFAPQVAGRGVPVAEFNMESTPATSSFGYHFEGPAGTFVPQALARHESEPM